MLFILVSVLLLMFFAFALCLLLPIFLLQSAIGHMFNELKSKSTSEA
jgi:hypothetical protein